MHSNNSWARGFMALFAIVLATGLALAASPAEAAPFLYVTNFSDNTVSVIDTATNTVVATVAVGNGPEGVAVTPDGDKGLRREQLTGNVSVIHTATNKTRAKTVPAGSEPGAGCGRRHPGWDKGLRRECWLQQCFGTKPARVHGFLENGILRHHLTLASLKASLRSAFALAA